MGNKKSKPNNTDYNIKHTTNQPPSPKKNSWTNSSSSDDRIEINDNNTQSVSNINSSSDMKLETFENRFICPTHKSQNNLCLNVSDSEISPLNNTFLSEFHDPWTFTEEHKLAVEWVLEKYDINKDVASIIMLLIPKTKREEAKKRVYSLIQHKLYIQNKICKDWYKILGKDDKNIPDVNVVILGSHKCGKDTLLSTYGCRQGYGMNERFTRIITVDGFKFRIVMKNNSIVNNYATGVESRMIYNSHVIILLIDGNKSSTYYHKKGVYLQIETYLRLIFEKKKISYSSYKNLNKIPIIIAGNKCDNWDNSKYNDYWGRSTDNTIRLITEEVRNDVTRTYNLSYLDISGYSKDNLELLFELAIKEYFVHSCLGHIR